MYSCINIQVATHSITKVQVAVKIINKKKMKNKNMISKVKRQIRILKFINHPNIIKLYEVLDTTSDIFIIMELANRGELYQNMQTDISEHQARFYFRQIIDGVEYIHRNHISHRDLKPENILIDENNLIKIGDFGLSNLMKDGKMLKTPCGSPFYAAPQILSQQKYQGQSVDIWSTGVILYALIVGSLPFDDQNTTKNNMRIKTGAYKIPQNVSPYARDLIQKMLQVDPRKRITIPELKSHPWIIFQIPLYLKISEQFIIGVDEECEIDEEVLSRIKILEINLHGYTQEKIRKAIIKRDDESFAIAYQLLKSEKDKKLYASTREIQQSKSTIFKKIENSEMSVGPPMLEPGNEKFIYGRVFQRYIKQLYNKLLKVLKNHQIEYEIKNNQYCIKCVYQTNKNLNGLKEKSKSQMLDESEQIQEKKQHIDNRNLIKFNVQIYQLNKKAHSYVVDMQLSLGHPQMFLPLSRSIYEELNN